MKIPPVYIHSKLPKELITFLSKTPFDSYFVLCDSNTLQYCLPHLVLLKPLLNKVDVIEIEPGEESKNIDVLENILQTLAENSAGKKSLFINLGGGVVCDIGGFAASIYKRGIPFIHIPTSLLCMADAAVGGKNGINFLGVKNILGTIHQPLGVYVNTSYLQSLPEQHLRNGFAEILKMALILDKKFFSQISHLKIQNGSISPALIKKAIGLKTAVIKKDPLEKKLRKILNFGHSAGHAIESLFMQNNLPLLHGQAVAIGMAIESYICLLLKRITQKEFDLIINSLKINYFFPSLHISESADFFTFFNQDKKHKGKQYYMALLNGIGKCDPEVKINRSHIEKALVYYNTILVNAASIQ
ncbi:MAG: 3-dehydroquinate synthase [Sphingobacteriaceae bacterium]|nr:3-dehydroquinate synthase [Sphingobacteriaceae bacterium]